MPFQGVPGFSRFEYEKPHPPRIPRLRPPRIRAKPEPHPDVYLAAAKLPGVDPLRYVAVEDSFNGVRPGAAASRRVITVPAYNEVTDEIRVLCSDVAPSLLELPAAVDQLIDGR